MATNFHGGKSSMSVTLHVTVITDFGSSTDIIKFNYMYEAVNAKRALLDEYSELTALAVVVTILEGTA
jgi:hypothetical protein